MQECNTSYPLTFSLARIRHMVMSNSKTQKYIISCKQYLEVERNRMLLNSDKCISYMYHFLGCLNLANLKTKHCEKLYYWLKYLLSSLLEYYSSPPHWCQAWHGGTKGPSLRICIPDTSMSDMGTCLALVYKMKGGAGDVGHFFVEALWAMRCWPCFLSLYYRLHCNMPNSSDC